MDQHRLLLTIDYRLINLNQKFQMLSISREIQAYSVQVVPFAWLPLDGDALVYPSWSSIGQSPSDDPDSPGFPEIPELYSCRGLHRREPLCETNVRFC